MILVTISESDTKDNFFSVASFFKRLFEFLVTLGFGSVNTRLLLPL